MPDDRTSLPDGTLTILFTDVEGSTDLRSRLGEDLAHHLMREHERLLREELPAHGGTEANFSGDGFMVVFASARRAIECAVAIQRRFEERNVDAEHPLRVRMGLNTGEVRREGAHLYGQAINAAARIAAQARGGEILISQVVRDLIAAARAFDVADRGAHDLKGFHEPWRLYEIVWNGRPSESPPRPAPVPAQPAAPALVGRDRELAALRAAVESARAGRGGIVMLAGEPGIGKTALADAAAAAASSSGVEVVWGRCWEGGGAPAYWPWVQVIRAVLRGEDAARIVAALGARAAHLAQLSPEVRLLAPGLDEPESSDPDAARFALFDSVTELLSARAFGAPMLLVLDDVHAADQPSLLLLRFLAKHIRTSSIALIATYRDAEARRSPDAGPLLEEIGAEGVVLRLAGLGAADVALMLAHAGGEEPGAAVLQRVCRATGGNPFFVDEVARLLARGEDDAAIPDRVREATSRRLSTLPEETVSLLTLAALVGQDFDLDVLAHAEERPRASVADLLEPAVAAGLVTEPLRALGRYSFRHALVRDALRDRLPASERDTAHGRLGAAMLDLHAGDLDDRLAAIAHHLFEAARTGDPLPAVDMCSRAGVRSTRLLAYEDAIGHFERALLALDRVRPPLPERRARLTLDLADAQWRAGRHAKCKETFARAAAIARDAGLPALVAEAAVRYTEADLGGTLTVAWEVDNRMRDLLSEALERMTEPSPLRARALGYLGASLHFTPRREEGIAMAREAVAMARNLKDDATLARCLAAEHLAVWAPESARERLALATEVVEIAERLGQRELQLQAHAWRHTDLYELGDLARAEAEMDTYVRLAEELGRPQYRAYTDMLMCARAIQHGRLEDALEHAYRARRYGEESGDATVRGSAGVQIVQVSYYMQKIDESADVLHECIELQRRWNQPATFYAMMTRDLRGLGEDQDRYFDGDRLSIPVSAFRMANILFLFEGASMLGDTAKGPSLYEAALPFAGHHVHAGRNCVVRYGPTSALLGAIAVFMGRFEDAERHLRHAREVAERAKSPTWLAQIALSEGRMFAARDGAGDRERAHAALDEATRLASSIGMTLVADGAAELRAGLESRDSAAPPSVFRSEGDVWLVAFGGETARVKETKGVRYLARLLAAPNRPLHALDLLASLEGEAHSGARVAADAPSRPGDGGAILDARAKAEFRERLSDLAAELAEARDFNDQGRVERAEAELEAIERELASAVGLGGRDRTFASPGERARVSVTKALRTAITHIAKRAPGIGAHLEAAVKTGTYCSYEPGAGPAPTWSVS